MGYNVASSETTREGLSKLLSGKRSIHRYHVLLGKSSNRSTGVSCKYASGRGGHLKTAGGGQNCLFPFYPVLVDFKTVFYPVQIQKIWRFWEQSQRGPLCFCTFPQTSIPMLQTRLGGGVRNPLTPLPHAHLWPRGVFSRCKQTTLVTSQTLQRVKICYLCHDTDKTGLIHHFCQRIPWILKKFASWTEK